ncbi:O-acetyltransferase OatA-like [Symsagittifera roscoffensis]|uniref:O-acetyltransferase OatA-like n=1 Tax=Symsagittifera roscoffensis TaxID=84072 RepID=UPI00307C3065
MQKKNKRRFGHRKHLDSIRGIACLLVILFHCEIPLFSNGYLGVDVFFTLSGFLITSILLEELSDRGEIDLVRFYCRRFSRLFPASCVVLVSTTFVYKQIELTEYVDKHKSSFFASAFYVENWHALKSSMDYFTDDASDQSPVMHYWSLSIEEQFYLFFPLLLSLLWHICQKNLTQLIYLFSIILLFATSFNYYLWSQNAMMSYLSTFGRLYQLLAGSLLSIFVVIGKMKDTFIDKNKASFKTLTDIISGLLVTFFAVTLFYFRNSETLYMGQLSVLLSVMIFAILEISSDNGKIRLLLFENSFLCYIGKLSYSMYLCHVPITKFGEILETFSVNEYLRAAQILGFKKKYEKFYYIDLGELLFSNTSESFSFDALDGNVAVWDDLNHISPAFAKKKLQDMVKELMNQNVSII